METQGFEGKSLPEFEQNIIYKKKERTKKEQTFSAVISVQLTAWGQLLKAILVFPGPILTPEVALYFTYNLLHYTFCCITRVC